MDFYVSVKKNETVNFVGKLIQIILLVIIIVLCFF